MTNKEIASLRNDYEEIVHRYCRVFAEKHEFEYYPCGLVDIVGTFEFGDYYFSFDDIFMDIDSLAPVDEIFKWSDHCLRLAGISPDIPTPNYRSWLSGCPRMDEEQIQKLEAAKQAVLDAEAELRKEINVVKIAGE